MVSNRSSPPVETVSGLPSVSRTTSEQVASKPMAPMTDASTPEAATAARTAVQTAAQMFSESCSA